MIGYRCFPRCNRSGRLWLLMITVCLLIFPVTVQASRDEVLAIKNWQGQITATASATVPIAGGNCQYTLRLDGSFDLGDYDPVLLRWEGKFTGSHGRYHASCHTENNGVVSDEVVTGEGPVLPSDTWQLELRLNAADNDYVFNWGSDLKEHRRNTMSIAGTTDTTEEDEDGHLAGGRDRMPLPVQGVLLNREVTAASQGQHAFNVHFTPDKWQFSYMIEPKGADQLRLEVAAAAYKTWRPQAEPGPQPGPAIELTASLRNQHGALANAAVLKYEWRLIDTSREPGIACNWPRGASDRDFDLKFEAGPHQQYADSTRQMLIGLTQGPQETARILPYDWGGWTILQVTAYLHDGRKVTGRLKESGLPEEEQIRLPWRDAGMFTAKAWVQSQGVDAAGDFSDDEDEPKGDNHQGDGLTLYEEYRGFYEAGRHVEGNPKKKDYFAMVEPSAKSMASGGLALFRRLSNLEVHDRLRPDELSAARVINANHADAPHRVDQHGVILKIDPSMQGFAQAKSIYSQDSKKGPNTPAGISYIGLPMTISNEHYTSDSAIPFTSVTVAHELFHTVNVWHHGDGDRVVEWSRGSDGVLYERDAEGDSKHCVASGPRHAIRVHLENGQDVTDDPQLHLGCRTLGVDHGQHSGFENCLMRYDLARAYIAKSDHNLRYAIKKEHTGTSLCTSGNGVSTNASGHQPQSRFGSAKANRGNCAGQILVNDAIPAPRRY